MPKTALEGNFTGSRPAGRSRFKSEEGVKEDAARLLRCRNWKLAAQNRAVWKQKLGEAKPALQALVPWDGWTVISKP